MAVLHRHPVLRPSLLAFLTGGRRHPSTLKLLMTIATRAAIISSITANTAASRMTVVSVGSPPAKQGVSRTLFTGCSLRTADLDPRNHLAFRPVRPLRPEVRGAHRQVEPAADHKNPERQSDGSVRVKRERRTTCSGAGVRPNISILALSRPGQSCLRLSAFRGGADITTQRPRPGSGVALQSPRRERVRHQLADAVPMEWNDEKKIEFTGQVVDRADGGDDHARSVAVGNF